MSLSSLSIKRGRVVRTTGIYVQHPSAADLAGTRDRHIIEQSAGYTAQCLQTLGVNTDFAPVLDLGSNHANALPGRCWGSEPQSVILGRGMESYRSSHGASDLR